MVAGKKSHLHLSDSVWLSLASVSADSGDAVCTRAAAAPATVRISRLLPWGPPWVWEDCCSLVALMAAALEGEAQAGYRWDAVAEEVEEAAGDPGWEQGVLSSLKSLLV